MRLVTYDRGGARRLGALVAGTVVDLPDAVGHPSFPATMEALVAYHGGTTLDAAAFALARPEAVETCALTSADYEELRRRVPALTDHLIATLAHRLRRMNERLVEALFLPAAKRVLLRLAEAAAAYAKERDRLMCR